MSNRRGRWPFDRSKGDHAFNYFSAVTTLGTPQDVALQESRIETFFPADAATERSARALREETP